MELVGAACDPAQVSNALLALFGNEETGRYPVRKRRILAGAEAVYAA
jgi:hypothetical protein